MGAIEYTGENWQRYMNYINGLDDTFWDHTSLAGLKDFEKNPSLVNSVLNYSDGAKVLAYYENNKLIVDRTIRGQVVDYVDDASLKSLKELRTDNVKQHPSNIIGNVRVRSNPIDLACLGRHIVEMRRIGQVLRTDWHGLVFP